MYKITKNNKPLDPKLYTIDKVNQTFASEENGLVIDFTGEGGWIFRIKYGCTITAGHSCIITAGNGCNITTGNNAVIRANWNSGITGGENCAVIRRDNNEVIMLVARQTIKLNDHMIEGYEVIKPIETIEIGGLKFNKEEVEDFLKNLKPIN